MKTFDTFCKVLVRICTFITRVSMIFLTILIGVNVIARFIFNSPITWQYETTLLLMPYIIFLGMVITFRNDEHMRLTFVSNAMPESFRNKFIVFLDLLVMIFLIYAAYLSIGVIKNAMQTPYQTIPVARGWFYFPFPFGCIFSVCQIINNSYKRLTGQYVGVDPEDKIEFK